MTKIEVESWDAENGGNLRLNPTENGELGDVLCYVLILMHERWNC